MEITKLRGRGNKNLKSIVNFKSYVKKWIIWEKRFIAILFGLFLFILTPYEILNSSVKGFEFENKEPKILSYETIHKLDQLLIKEVENYIQDNSFGSQLSGKNLVKICYQQNFDIVLALSQAQIESHFGTRGLATRTNSVFNVGSYDDGTILYRYRHPDLSIEPYIYLVKNNYLKDKSAEDLLKPMSFVNYKGKRYASLRQYETRVKGVYDQIKLQTNIYKLWKIASTSEARYSRKVWNSVDRFYKILENDKRSERL